MYEQGLKVHLSSSLLNEERLLSENEALTLNLAFRKGDSSHQPDVYYHSGTHRSTEVTLILTQPSQ